MAQSADLAKASPPGLVQLEEMATLMYAPETPQDQRIRAQQALNGFSTSIECISQCQLILDHSKVPYALLLAGSSLLKLLNTFWNSFTAAQTLNIRNYLLNYLAARCSTLPSFVITSLIQVLVRISKLGWNQDAAHRSITESIEQFLEHTPGHLVVGLQMLSELVNQMNTPCTSQTFAKHRKIAVAFRDLSLFQVFSVTLKTLNQIKCRAIAVPPEAEENLKQQALKVALQCLCFDYIGMNPDEAAEDGGTIQIPSTWRVCLEEPESLSVFFDIFFSAQKPQTSALCLEVLVQLSATRQSLFSAKDTRLRFIANLCHGTTRILQSRHEALKDSDCFHQFCRLLGRLKAACQLEELLAMPGYEEWVALVADFTLEGFKRWEWASQSVEYLILLWSRVTMDIPYMIGELPAFLEGFIPKVNEAFIMSRLENFPHAVAQGSLDEVFDLLDESLLKHLPTLFKYRYLAASVFFKQQFHQIRSTFEAIVQRASATRLNDQEGGALIVAESQLAFLTYVVGSLVSSSRAIGSMGQDVEAVDSELCACVFQLLPAIEFRTGQNISVPKSTHLELALLYFLDSFRKRYLGITATRRVIINPEQDPTIFGRLSQHLQQATDENTLLVQILHKILSNLRVWQAEGTIVGNTLTLLDELSASCPKLCALESCQALLRNHSLEQFPFMKYPGNQRYITTFYITLARLAYKQHIDVDDENVGSEEMDQFEEFVVPFDQAFAFINSQPTLRNPAVSKTAILLCRQLQGVVAGTSLKRPYNEFFDWIYHKHLPVLLRLLETWWDCPEVTTPILRFYSEFVYNKAQRITFHPSSPNGILLFRETSKALSIFSTRCINIEANKDFHKEKLKGVALCLRILHRSLSGGYVNFGVLSLYGDKALSNGLNAVLKVMLVVPFEQYLIYQKVSRDFFTFLEILYRHHMDLLLATESKVLWGLTSSLHEGLHHTDTNCASDCAAALDHLFTYIFRAQRNSPQKNERSKVNMRQLAAHLAEKGDLFTEILASLFNRILFDHIDNVWSMSRPVLSLILIDKQALEVYQQRLLAAQVPAARPAQIVAFNNLMEGIQPSLSISNREKFNEQISTFRLTVQKHCVAPR